jgi:exodeoxyribonuclease VIII
LLTQGIAEQTILFDEPQTGAKCKIRPDWMSGTGFLTDIKTTEDASPHGFGRSAYNYRYHVQGGFYVDGWAYGTGEMPEGFAFIAVEKEPPYNVAVYYMTEDAFSLGRSSYLRNLETYMKCLQNNKWPGYSNLMEPLSIPAYALK